LRYVPNGTVLKDHELLPIWNQFNANPPDVYSTTKIITEARTLPGDRLEADHYKSDLIHWEQVAAQKRAWYDSVYGQCPGN
jgi:hypothetical protein